MSALQLLASLPLLEGRHRGLPLHTKRDPADAKKKINYETHERRET